MSMKRILGTMLASRMGGRGRRRGALGTASALGLLGSRRRRGSLGGKLGLAALGYMAYQAYQSNQSQNGGQAGQSGAGQAQSGGANSLVDKIRDTANDLLGAGSQDSPQAESRDLTEGERAAEDFSEDEALLMIRAMITAAYADGQLSQDERERIVEAIGEADATPQERATMEREIANPQPLDALLSQVNDKETAEEFYLVSRAAVDGDSEGDRRHLETLRQRLDISEDEARDADEIAA